MHADGPTVLPPLPFTLPLGEGHLHHLHHLLHRHGARHVSTRRVRCLAFLVATRTRCLTTLAFAVPFCFQLVFFHTGGHGRHCRCKAPFPSRSVRFFPSVFSLFGLSSCCLACLRIV